MRQPRSAKRTPNKGDSAGAKKENARSAIRASTEKSRDSMAVASAATATMQAFSASMEYILPLARKRDGTTAGS